MTDYTVGATIPRHHYGIKWRSATQITVCQDADLAEPDANVQAMSGPPVKVLKATPVTVGPEFFGTHILERVNDTATAVTYKTVRSHDMKDGTSRWSVIQPTDTQNLASWNFTVLDTWVNTHYAAGRDLVFTLFATPTWASARPTEEGAYGPANLGLQAEPLDMTDWDFFCTTIATRYLGKIKYYEVWNEPNQSNDGTGVTGGTSFFFSGTWAKLAEMTRRANQAIKAVDPTAKIISPSITNWSSTASQSAENYLTGLLAASDGATGTAKDWIDIVAVHLYLPLGNSTDTLAGMIDRIDAVKTAAGISAKETWDTESAPILIKAPAMTDLQMRKYFMRFFVTLAAKGISRTTYYYYDSTVFGFNGRTDLETYWNQLRTHLMSGNILKVSQLFDGRIVCTTNEGQKVY